MRYLLLIIPTCLLGGCLTDEKDDSRAAYAPHYATAWTVTPGGIMRDAGPFGSVGAGYTSDLEIDAALDWARADFATRFPEYSWVNPVIHLTDDYFFWVAGAGGGFAAGWHIGDGQVALTIWTRLESVDEPADGSVWIKRPPGEFIGSYNANWRSTALRLVPAYQHEALHAAIGDPRHTSSLWSRL